MTGVWWVEARGAAKNPTMHRTSPHNKYPKCQLKLRNPDVDVLVRVYPECADVIVCPADLNRGDAPPLPRQFGSGHHY